MRQIKITPSEDAANKAVIQIMQRQGKVIAMRPYVMHQDGIAGVGIAIEYEEN